uniref:DNA topoisomerase n=1 Tax=Acrobeloides nanus TaxID=290746 RepID=A0A914C8T8_9BILA
MDEIKNREEFLERLKLASKFEAMIKDFEKKIEPYVVRGNREKILELFEGMSSFVGPMLIDALTLVDKLAITWVYADQKWTIPGVYEVNHDNKTYHLYRDVNFCVCDDFQEKVLNEGSEFTNYEFEPAMKKWEEVPIERLFDARIFKMTMNGMDKIDETLRQQARQAEILIIWTDCDREGENIGAEIVSCALQVNQRIDIYRAKFSEITPAAINRAMRNLVRLDEKIIRAVDCRQELDLRIGAAFTRLQTLNLRRHFGNHFSRSDVISYGSCQFPTLGFVVERYKAIQEFVSEQFWKLIGRHMRDGKKVEFTWARSRLFNENAVEIFRDLCLEAGIATVIGMVKKPKSKWRPLAMDTVELEKLAVRKLRMSAKTAMSIAEKLYGKGYISYPRTETNIFPKELDLRTLVEAQTQNQNWGPFAADILARGEPFPRNGRKSDEAHPPIHPLKFVTKNELTERNEWALYELVVRHFLACVSRDASGQETKITVEMGGEEFVATGLMVEDRGYLEVYPYEKWSDKELPIYTQGEQLKDFKVDQASGFTQPPELLTEADLIALMDRYGIGTDATHAEHIEKIKERKYVVMDNRLRFVPQDLGLSLVDAYNLMGYEMSKPNLRADLERQLVAICNGARQKDEVLTEQLGKYRRIFRATEDKINVLADTFRRYRDNHPPGDGGNGPPGGPGGGGPGGGGNGPRGDGPPRPPRAPRPAVVDDTEIGIYTAIHPAARQPNSTRRKRQPAGKDLR